MYLMHILKNMIMSNVRKHPAKLVDATKAYAEATISSVRFLIADNECMAKELQSTKKGEEQVTTSIWEKLK